MIRIRETPQMSAAQAAHIAELGAGAAGHGWSVEANPFRNPMGADYQGRTDLARAWDEGWHSYHVNAAARRRAA